VAQGRRLGSVQSTGFTCGYGDVAHFLNMEFDRSRWSWAMPLRPLLRIPAYAASLLWGKATVFATIMEDLAYPENRIVLAPDEPSGICIKHVPRPELRERRELFRKLIGSTFVSHRVMLLSRGEGLNYGHPSGTCRFGSDPAASVLDANNKAHDLDNLYVSDASFMPTSGGANPSLTIAANALRVAQHVSSALARAGTC
jgi:choline dehydrogenase-like flavoprotein